MKANMQSHTSTMLVMDSDGMSSDGMSMDHSMHQMQSSEDSKKINSDCCDPSSSCQMTNCTSSVVNLSLQHKLQLKMHTRVTDSYLVNHSNTPPDSLYRPPILA